MNDSISISNWEDLASVENDLSGTYTLVNNLTPDSIGYHEFVESTDNGWGPIGSIDNPFTGKINGNNHVISGLRIDHPNVGNLGLFNTVKNGQISDIIVESANISGGGPNIGVLVGKSINSVLTSNTIRNGTVMSNNPENGNNTGGLVGEIKNGQLKQTYVDATIHSARSRVGGIVGQNTGGEINTSFANVAVTAKESNHGGITGYSATKDSKIIDCGSVVLFNSIGPNTGGIAGVNDGKIIQCFAIGDAFTTHWNPGGIVAVHRPTSIIKNSYWEQTLAAEPAVRASRKGGGRIISVNKVTKSDILGSQAKKTLAGFDFANIWNTMERPDGYPKPKCLLP